MKPNGRNKVRELNINDIFFSDPERDDHADSPTGGPAAAESSEPRGDAANPHSNGTPPEASNDLDEAAIREQLTARALGQSADALSNAQAHLAALGHQKDQCADVSDDIKRNLETTTLLIPPSKPCYALPDGAARWKVAGLFAFFALVVVAGWANLAQYAVNSEQSWVLAALMAFPLVIFPIALKDLVHPGGGTQNRWSYFLLVLFGLGAFGYYLYAFANNYVRQPSLDDILNAKLPAKDLRGQLIAQVVLEMVVNVSLLWGYKTLLVPADKVLNPAWVLLHRLWESLSRRLAALEVKSGHWRGQLIKVFTTLEAAISDALRLHRSREADLKRKLGR